VKNTEKEHEIKSQQSALEKVDTQENSDHENANEETDNNANVSRPSYWGCMRPPCSENTNIQFSGPSKPFFSRLRHWIDVMLRNGE